MSQQMLDELKQEIKNATNQHFKMLNEKYPGDYFYGYSLYTSDDVSEIGPVSNRLSALKFDENSPDYAYYRYCPNEWSEWDDFGLFDEANRIIHLLYDEMKDSFLNYKRSVLNQALQALKELSTEGLFGAQTDERFLIIFLSDSHDKIMEVAAKELNTIKAYEDFMSLF